MAEKKKPTQSASDASVEELTNALYASCATKPDDTLWFQEDFLKLKVIPGNNLEQLNECISRLTRDDLLKLHTRDGRACWKVIAKEDAAKFRDLSTDEAIVYSYIQSAGTTGAWNKQIRIRSNLHDTVCKRVLKSLEGKNFVKKFKSAKQPSARFYILAHLQPSEEATGGAFYEDGKLDEEFVESVAKIMQQYIHKRSWQRVSSKDAAKKGKGAKLSSEEAGAARAEGLDTEPKVRNKLLPKPPGYRGYPTLSEITANVNGSKFFQIKLREAEVQQILDMLCWQGRIETVLNGAAFKTILSAPLGEIQDSPDVSNEAPCIHCPVFDFCDENGPVNAQTCPYFQDWLAI